VSGVRAYRYQGRPDLLKKALEHPPDPPIRSQTDLDPIASFDDHAGTWVVTAPDGHFRCGARRREHVDVAGGGEVHAAGEIWFELDRQKRWVVARITNRSIGYGVPLPASYAAVRAAFERIGIAHATGAYDETFVSGLCPEHGLQVLRDGDAFECKVCFAAILPVHADR
jgi:hypothetical protein